MNRFAKSAILSLAVAATTLTSLPAAQAGDRWHGRHHHSRSSGEDLAIAGVLGLAAGALVVGLTAQPPEYSAPDDDGYVYRRPNYGNPYRHPRPRPDRDYVINDPRDVAYDGYEASMEPWTPEWYQYCNDRYRSFNARTGTYAGYDGLKHFCSAD